MKREDIDKLVELTNEFNDACTNVCKHLMVLNDDYKHCYEFEIDHIDTQIECRGYYTVMNESQDVYAAFPTELLTYTNEELDEYVNKEMEKKTDINTLKRLADKYGYELIIPKNKKIIQKK